MKISTVFENLKFQEYYQVCYNFAAYTSSEGDSWLATIPPGRGAQTGNQWLVSIVPIVF